MVLLARHGMNVVGIEWGEDCREGGSGGVEGERRVRPPCGGRVRGRRVEGRELCASGSHAAGDRSDPAESQRLQSAILAN